MISTTKIKLYIFLIAGLWSGGLFAQSTQEASTKPLELPAFIIEGVEQHNIRSSIKQNPRSPRPLSSAELDSLNTAEKLSPTLLPVDKLPTHYLNKDYTEGFISASFGMFMSPELSAGYRFFADKFDIFATAGGSLTNGDALNSNNNKLFLDIRTSYIADEKFFIFGGSNTKTNIFVNNQNYNFFGYGSANAREHYPDKDYYDRTLTQAKIEVISDGSYENVLFSVGGAGNYIAANNSNEGNHLLHSDLTNYSAEGFLSIKNYWNNFSAGGNLLINLESLAGRPFNHYEAAAQVSYFAQDVSVLLRGGVQLADIYADNKESNRTSVMLESNIEYRISKAFTLTAHLFSGLVPTDFEPLISQNPYLSSRLSLDHRYDIANIRASLWYHPNENLQLQGGISWRMSERNVNFIPDTLAEFRLAYVDGSMADIFGEAMWNLTAKDRIIGNVNLNISSPDGNYNFTYLPALRLGTTYYRNVATWLNAFITLEFSSSRHTNTQRSISGELDPGILLNAGADITFKPIKIFVKLNNILNTDYMMWAQYAERGFFAALGVTWMF